MFRKSLQSASAAAAASPAVVHAAEGLFRALEAQSDLHGRHAVLRSQQGSVDALLRAFDRDADGVLQQEEARSCFDVLSAAKAATSRSPLRPLSLDSLSKGEGGYPLSELRRAARCELWLREDSPARKGPSSGPISAAVSIVREVYGSDAKAPTGVDPHGRAFALRRIRRSLNALTSTFAPSGAMPEEQALAYVTTLITAEAAARGALPDHRAPREWLGRMEPSADGTFSVAEARRVARLFLMGMPEGAVTAETAQLRAQHSLRDTARLFRELQAAGSDLAERGAVLRREGGVLRAVLRLFDRDGDDTLSPAEAAEALSLLLSAEAAARGAASAEPGTVGGARLLSQAEPAARGYPLAEIERVARSELLMTSRGIPRAEAAAEEQGAADAVTSAAAALCRRIELHADLPSRVRALRRERGAIDALLRAFDGDADGVLSAAEARRCAETLVAAREDAAQLQRNEISAAAAALLRDAATSGEGAVAVSEMRRLAVCELAAAATVPAPPAAAAYLSPAELPSVQSTPVLVFQQSPSSPRLAANA